MEIYLRRRTVRQIRDAAREAAEDGDTDALREEILDALPEEHTELLEQAIDGDDLYDFINTMLEDWGGDDVDELFELLESSFADVGIELVLEYEEDEDDDDLESFDDDSDDEFPIDDSYDDEP